MSSTILDSHDCGVVTSLTVLAYPALSGDSCATRRFVAYTRRPDRDILLCEDLGDHLGPKLAEFSGSTEGDVTLQADIGGIIVYFTGRQPGDTSGPFQLQRERVTIPNIWPLDLAAALRVRNLARILSKYLPVVAEELKPYTT